MSGRSTSPQHHSSRQSAEGDEANSVRNDYSDGDNRLTKRPRASRPKVKSGCITCKTRRVKCDETKPQCLRCRKFGHQCDGYQHPSSGRGSAVMPIKPRIPTIIYSPSVSVPGTDEEFRYFQSFQENSDIKLSGFFSNDFWSSLVLQESHEMAPVRHAVIAMGALNKSLEGARVAGLKVNVIQEVNKKHHENAVFHHLKAIQSLNQYISTSKAPQLRVALISCLLFVCFETFQGSFASSVQQTYGGLKLLRSYYSGQPGSRPWIPSKPLRDPFGFNSRNVNKALQLRPGCDNVSKDRAIAMHIEEYLEIENLPQVDSENRFFAKTRRPPVQPVDDPRAGQIDSPNNHVAVVDLAKDQRQATSSSPESNRSIYSPTARRLAPLAQAPQLSIQRIKSFDSVKSESEFSGRKSSISSSEASVIGESSRHGSPDGVPVVKQTSLNRKRPLESQSTKRSGLQNDYILEEALIQTFVRLDGQGLFFGMIPGIPPLIWDIHKTHHLPIPERFDDFNSAQRCWDFLMDRALQFYRRTAFNRAYAPGHSDDLAQIARQHASYITQLSKFDHAFRPILDRAISPDGKITNPAALIVSLYQRITVITLASIRTDSEMVYDAHLADFQYITRTCTALITVQSNTRFSFEVGIVPPLHVTATKCRDPVVRREAIKLLFASPRQEGMWDGVLTARIGEWLMRCEEDGLPSPPLEVREPSAEPELPEMQPVAQESFNYPSPPQGADELAVVGAWEDGRRISNTVNQAIAAGEYVTETDGAVVSNRRRKVGGSTKGKEKAINEENWIVPEENRVQLMVVDFHIPKRYIKVKCQKALLREDGSREERESVIAW